MWRIYLDFDGVVAPLKATPDPELRVRMPYTGLTPISLEVLEFLRSFDGEIVWISHREEDTKIFTDIAELPTYRHLTFDDPTGSKVQAILDDLEANPPEDPEGAVVIDDDLTDEEIQDLTVVIPVYKPNGDHGLDVEDFKQTVLGDGNER